MLCLGFTLAFNIHYHYKYKLKKMKKDFKCKSSDTIYTTGLLKWQVLETVFVLFVYPPGLDLEVIEGEMIDGYYVYSYNDFFSVMQIFKGYTLFRLTYHYSRWTSIESEDVARKFHVLDSSLFPFKCELKFRPFKVLAIILSMTLVYVTPIFRIFEIGFITKMDRVQYKIENTDDSIWSVIISMTTVGYGDFYPQTHFGRFSVTIACLIGMLLTSYLVVGMNALFDFSSQEERAYGKLKKLSAQD